METKKINYQVGEIIHVTAIEGKDGEAIAVKSGIICLFDRRAKINPGIGQTWKCQIKRVNEKSLILNPIEMICNENGLTVMGLHFLNQEKPQKYQKVKPNYKYLSKNEQ